MRHIGHFAFLFPALLAVQTGVALGLLHLLFLVVEGRLLLLPLWVRLGLILRLELHREV